MTMFPLPLGVKKLHLPTHTISKPKLLSKPNHVRSPETLELYVQLVCTSAMLDEEKKRRALARAAIATHNFTAAKSPSEEGGEDEDKKPQNGGEVKICAGCITRERKRAARKKVKKPEEEELWNRYESQRVIVFNTNETKEWQPVTSGLPEAHVPTGTVEIDAPMRIACYCRHQSEKMGFQVIFTIRDYQDNVVCQQLSPSIMITDDHKTHLPASQSSHASNNADGTTTPSAHKPAVKAPAVPQAAPPLHAMASTPANSAPNGAIDSGIPFRQSQSTSDLQHLARTPSGAYPVSNPANASISQATSSTATPRNLSRQASPTAGVSGPLPKKRKASGSINKVPSTLAMTRLETQPPTSQPTIPPADSASVSAATSPFSPTMNNFGPGAEAMFGQNPNGMGAVQNPWATGPPTPNSNDQSLFAHVNRSGSIENLAMAPMFSAPVSAHPSRAPSPNNLRQEAMQMQQTQFPQPAVNSIYGTPSTLNLATPSPVIHKIIPGEGPKSGGIEVTILGSGFAQGQEVLFGDMRATTTTFWGETTLACLLPPSPVAGYVPVSIKQQNQIQQTQNFAAKNRSVFRYVDDEEDGLIRLALEQLSKKMTGNSHDIGAFARSIIEAQNGSFRASSSAGFGGQQLGNAFNSRGGEPAHTVETGLLRALELMDMDDSPHNLQLDLRLPSGQTMLHLAASLGLHRLVAGLISRGANPVARDRGGFTPIHMAAMNNHPEIIRRLILAGADPTMRSLSGLSPSDVAQSRDVLRVLRRIERHTRSRSGVSLYSRTSSATSLRSIWEPPVVDRSSQEPSSRSESPEYSEGSYEDSSEEAATEEEDEGQWLNMRRPSVAPGREVSSPSASVPAPDSAFPAPIPSPTAAVNALREQFAAQLHQLQQSWQMHLQNLPQFQMPQIPAFPNRPAFHGYQEYLHNAPVVQRIASLVPNITRPGSAGEHPAERDHRWFDNFFGAKDSPPPSYEEIFPQSDLDAKQASAAQAAAEADADRKCSRLYDQQTAESSTQRREVPALLQIGRKNAITKEQQENLQLAHAQKLKPVGSDKNLFFIWIPLLVLIMGAMLYNRAPAVMVDTWRVVDSVRGAVANTGQVLDNMQERVVEVL